MIRDNERHRVIFGCGNFGGMGSSPSLRGHGDSPEQATTLLDAARAAGLTRFDTANTYGGGVSETVLGDWLARQDADFRDRVEVTTKVGNPHGSPAGTPPLERAEIARNLDQSLRRLRRERIDLYYLHEFEAVTPLEETLEAISRAIAAGKVAAFGASNARKADLEAILAAANDTIHAAFGHVQNEFNRLARGDLDTVIPFARGHGLAYTAFSPLAGGLLTGKYRRDATPDAGTRIAAASEHYAAYLTPETFAEIDALEAEAGRQGWTPAGAALRWILDTPGVASLIIAPRRVEHFAGYGLA